jgi:hypothetical protein
MFPTLAIFDAPKSGTPDFGVKPGNDSGRCINQTMAGNRSFGRARSSYSAATGSPKNIVASAAMSAARLAVRSG